MLALEWKGRAFIEKVNPRCCCWFPAAILVDSFCPPIIGVSIQEKVYKGAWNVSANNSETVSHKDLRFGQIVYILVFYNISFSWLLPLDGFQFIFWCRVYCVTVKTSKRRLKRAWEYQNRCQIRCKQKTMWWRKTARVWQVFYWSVFKRYSVKDE